MDLFGKIQAAIDNNAFSLVVTYNDQLGYPIRIAIDQNEMIVDEEITYIVSNLQ